MFRTKLIILIAAFVNLLACGNKSTKPDFIKVENGQFIKDGKPYNYIGTNYWYGANLAADTIGGDRNRLIKELDFMKAHGIDNLRVLVGAEGPDNQPYRVTPTTIKSPGVYSPKLLEGLDFFLNELKKRDMVAILYLTNNWEWSGGMAQYLNWNDFGEFVNPNLPQYEWNDFLNYQKQFYGCEPCKEQVNNFIKEVVSRTNTINGIKYINDPSIMAWELANEPRPMSKENFDLFKNWIKSTSELIKSLDPNHLVTTGNEGEQGCHVDLELFKEIHSYPSIDYLTFHIWVKNWGWYDYTNPDSTLPEALNKVQKYFDDHIKVASALNKPLVLEEFGLARDYQEFMPGTPTTYRDNYYNYAFNEIAENIKIAGPLAGANFWAFGGFALPKEGQIHWKAGDPYSGDPPQEEQGLNSVFASDSSTLKIIKKYNTQFGRIVKE